jgi:hypothetical protein
VLYVYKVTRREKKREVKQNDALFIRMIKLFFFDVTRAYLVTLKGRNELKHSSGVPIVSKDKEYYVDSLYTYQCKKYAAIPFEFALTRSWYALCVML